MIRCRGSHQTFYNSNTDKITTISMHSRDLPRGTVKAILKQINISKKEFLKVL
jgi:predicted RNA binding protein YcfA (HicA-like mRNA interferase family)